MVDCSHGNSQKKHERQVIVADDVVSFPIFPRCLHLCSLTAFLNDDLCAPSNFLRRQNLQSKQLSSPETCDNIMGVMIESNLVEGKQSIPTEGPSGLTYGQSVTDGQSGELHSSDQLSMTNDCPSCVISLHKLANDGRST